jgi:hypothetical protein
MDVKASEMAGAAFRECQLVDEFLRARVRPRVEHALGEAPGEAAQTYFGILLRVQAWMNTLSKLDAPVHFQAIVVGCRSLFESAVDLVLVRLAPERHPVEKLIAWEESEKLKSAIKIRDFFAGIASERVPSEFKPHLDFIAKNSEKVNKSRQLYWADRKGKPFHPGRWTGTDLGTAAAEAARLVPDAQFDVFYATRYPQICWNTHGSGLAGVRFLSEEVFHGMVALTFEECARFAVLGAEQVLRLVDVWNDEVAAEFEVLRRQRILTKAAPLVRSR